MRHPVVFIHGLWLHASSWDRWVTLFGDRGYAALAPGWPGDEQTVEATRNSSGQSACAGASELTEHYAQIAAELPSRPVLIGHGLGGLLALALAPQTHPAGVIAIETLLVSAMVLTREQGSGPGRVALSRDEFHEVYGRALSREESDRLHERWAIPAPHWALSDPVTPAQLTPGSDEHATNSSRSPVLLVASGQGEHQRAARNNSGERRLVVVGGDFVVFPDRGPSLNVDSGWRLVAESCLSWMDAYEL